MRILVLVGTLFLAGLVSPALATPLTKEARELIASEIFRAGIHSNPRLFLEACRAAEQKAAEYDLDPFFDGLINECLGAAEAHLKNKQAACTHFARALMQSRAVRASHPEFGRVKEWTDRARRWRARLGC